MTDLEIDLSRIADLAAARQDEYEILLYQLQLDDEIDDTRLDAFVEAIAAPIRQTIDCTQCANCCRSIRVFITPADIQVLAEGTGRPTDEITARYVATPAAGDDMTLYSCPCKFLDDTLCSVYRFRPQTCRDYPAFAPNFRWTLENTIAGASICPIIYNVLDELIQKIDSVYSIISIEEQ